MVGEGKCGIGEEAREGQTGLGRAISSFGVGL